MSKRAVTDHDPIGAFAVFGRSPSGKRAAFKFLANTEEEAIDAAQRLSAACASDGLTDFSFYVVEIKARMGIENGKYVE